jgi:uncharacterized protein (AIM24 family)
MSVLPIGDSHLSAVPNPPQEKIFTLETNRMLKVRLQNTMIWTRLGSMVAYDGQMKFSREGMLEHGFKRFVKKTFSREDLRLSKAQGEGTLYLADSGKQIRLINVANHPIVVNGNDILAFEKTVDWDIKFMKITAMLAGGLTNVTMKGTGMVAITTHYDPVTLKVTPEKPLMTDPNATVAWSANLNPRLKTDVSARTFIGRGSGEGIQLMFEGEGFVVIQPYEEVRMEERGESGWVTILRAFC